MYCHLKEDLVCELITIVLNNGISLQVLLAKCDRNYVAMLPFPQSEGAAILLAIQYFNRVESLADDSVPMLLLLAGLICALNQRKSRDIVVALNAAREVYTYLPIASQRYHKEIGNLLFLDAPTVPGPAPLPIIPPLLERRVNLATLATAGALAGGATSLMVVLFPDRLGGGAEGLHCTMIGVAAIPAGALGAIHLWAAAEAIAGTRLRVKGRLLQYVLVSLAAIVGGGTLNLLAHALSEMPFTFSGWRAWLPLGIAGASGALFLAWSDVMARPSTVFMAAWTGVIAAGGTFAGYVAYVAGVRLLVGFGPSALPYLDPMQKAIMVGAGAFAFVTITQMLMAFHLHGKHALQLDAATLPVMPARAIVPNWVLQLTAFTALAVSIAYLAHTWASALRAALP